MIGDGRNETQMNSKVAKLDSGQLAQVLREEGAVAELLHRGHAQLLQLPAVVPTPHRLTPRPLEQHALQHQHLAVVPLRRLLLRQHRAAPLVHLRVRHLLQPTQLLREHRRGHVGAATARQQRRVLQEHQQVAACGELREQLREQLHRALADGESGGERGEVGAHQCGEEAGGARQRGRDCTRGKGSEEGVGRTNGLHGVLTESIVVGGEELRNGRWAIRQRGVGRQHALRLHHFPRHFQTCVLTQLVIASAFVNMIPQLQTAQRQHVPTNALHFQRLPFRPE